MAGADVVADAELETVLAQRDLDGLSELPQVGDDLLELRGGQPRRGLVLLRGDLHPLDVQAHEPQAERGDPVLVAALALEGQRGAVLVELQPQGVPGSEHLEDLGERVHVHAEGHRLLACELGEGSLVLASIYAGMHASVLHRTQT